MTPEEERDYLIERYRSAIREHRAAWAGVDAAHQALAFANLRNQRADDLEKAFGDVLLAEGLSAHDIAAITREEEQNSA